MVTLSNGIKAVVVFEAIEARTRSISGDPELRRPKNHDYLLVSCSRIRSKHWRTYDNCLEISKIIMELYNARVYFPGTRDLWELWFLLGKIFSNILMLLETANMQSIAVVEYHRPTKAGIWPW